ncbi:MAG: site-specific DNA-methyltransferase [Paludibacteraceae bacterium]|nr:site-specific DNA-methyltransferase [Paludibacteraceae bacterium]
MNGHEIINSVIQGNCLHELKKIPNNFVDLIFADPPYNMQTDGVLLRSDGSKFNGVDDAWDKFESFEAYDNFCYNWLLECHRVMKDDASIWVIGSFQNIYRIGKIMQDIGFWIINDIIWSKPNAVPNFAGTRFQNSHETLLWCTKSKKSKFQFNYKTMKFLNCGKQMKSVWDIGICIGNERLKDIHGNKVHSTQKPEKLLYNVILSSTEKGDIILDPFFGTGTTGAVAKRLQRNFIGIEREEFYIEYAKQRIEETKVEDSDLISNKLDVKPPRFSIKQLIDLNLLSVGQLLYDIKRKYTVEILSTGNVRLNETELSIHKASAKLLNQSNHNGWEYFWCYFDSEFISINELRYKAAEKGGCL